MAYRLKLGHAVHDVKRVANEQLESAARGLRGEVNITRGAAIHEARKSIKKTRALLRLVRAEVGPLYDVENTRLRNLGRKLSGSRDAAVLVETFDTLVAKYAHDLPTHRLDPLRRVLVLHREQAERQLDSGSLLKRAASTLTAAALRTADWPLKTPGFAAIAPGLERTYRSGRSALATALAQPAPETFHQLRKRVKDHWYHVRLLEDLWTGIMQAYQNSLKELETWLGDDHNLVVLREHVLSRPELRGNIEETKLLGNLIDRYQHELRDQALASAQRVYAEKPRQFAARMGRLWQVDEHQSKTARRKHSNNGQRAGRGRTAA